MNKCKDFAEQCYLILVKLFKWQCSNVIWDCTLSYIAAEFDVEFTNSLCLIYVLIYYEPSWQYGTLTFISVNKSRFHISFTFVQSCILRRNAGTSLRGGQGRENLPPSWIWKTVPFLCFCLIFFNFFTFCTPPQGSRSKCCPPPGKNWNDVPDAMCLVRNHLYCSSMLVEDKIDSRTWILLETSWF